MASTEKARKGTSEVGKRFAIFVMPLDENGIVNEAKCGWLKLKPEIDFVLSPDEAMKFVAKQHGHGSFEDWKAFFEE